MKRIIWCVGDCLKGAPPAKCDVGGSFVEDSAAEAEIIALEGEGRHILDILEIVENAR